jgi:hypothetical protein
MAETITTVLQATLVLTDDTVLTVTDDQGIARSVTIATNNTSTYWRPFVAYDTSPTTPSTDAASPKNLCAHIKAQLNAGGSSIWSVLPNAAGFIVFTYTGIVRNGTITFPDTILRNVLGFQANVACSMGGGTSQSSYHPTHTAYFLGPSNATNWVDDPPEAILAEPRDGSTYGPSDSAAVQTYTFKGLFHPYDWTARTTLGLAATDGSATPYQGDSSRRKARSTTAGITPPYGLVDFRSTCTLNNSTPSLAKCGAVIGLYQSVLTGGVSTFDDVYLSADTLTKSDAFEPSVANWALRMNWKDITLRYYATVSF